MSISAFAAAGGMIAATALTVGLGQGRIARTIVAMVNEQPAAEAILRRTGLMALVLAETAVIMAGIGAVMVMLGSEQYTISQVISAFLALIIPAACAGYMSKEPAIAALRSIARQPFQAGRITTTMLITMTVLQTPVILGFIVALLVFMRPPLSYAHSIAYIGAGVAVGIGSVGPLLGLSRFGSSVCRALGYTPRAYGPLMPFLFVGQALIETPSLLALIVALSLILIPPSQDTLLTGLIALIAGCTAGIVTAAPGIASGKTASAACAQIQRYPDKSRWLMQISLIAQTFIDTAALYGIVAALVMIIFGL